MTFTRGLAAVLVLIVIPIARFDSFNDISFPHDLNSGSRLPLNCCFKVASYTSAQQARNPQTEENYLWRLVVRVIDGDTLLLDGKERVRLIGVDTPETVDPRRPVQRFGKEASAFTKFLTQSKKVRLEFDQTKKDRYGRTLAYVYLEDGRFVNAEIIRQGYGFAYTQYPFRYLQEFRQYEKEARDAQRGLWKP